MNSSTIQFVRHEKIVSVQNVPPSRTLLELLREDLNYSDTKEGCNEGDCGACTVVIGEAHEGQVKYSAINSCIRLAHSVNGLALWTAQDLVAQDGSLHPVQEAMVQCHASQCGFCTPGFVMSLFGMYQNHVTQGTIVSRESAQEGLSGNLCRCTGYRPILHAAQLMTQLPVVQVDEASVLQKLNQINLEQHDSAAEASYFTPKSLSELLDLRAEHPDAQLVAGCTDVGLWVTKLHMQFEKILDVSHVQDLRRVEDYPHHIAIGAAVTIEGAFNSLVAQRPQLRDFALRFAGLPVRNSGTLGGNIANGSPIGDSMPLLIALGANVVLTSQRGNRELPLEALYTGYRKNVIAADEVLAWIKVPKPVTGEICRVYKVSKRFEDDISAICLAIHLLIENGRVLSASIGVGGVAEKPVRASKTEMILTGEHWTKDLVLKTMQTLRNEFSPISDMRASAKYRVQVLGNLLLRFWLDSQGLEPINLESFTLEKG